jgi:quercetin dioxygenase-like cupin family protein
MQKKLIERTHIELNMALRETTTVTHLSDAADPRWVGIVDLGPSATHRLDAGSRYDLYVLRGKVEVNDCSLDTEDFLVQGDTALVRAGQDGARLLVYREASDARFEPVICGAKERVWHDGRNPRMHVVPLAGNRHHVSLVAWQPGALTQDHTHPGGEEIFVLRGVLRDGDERYPAGSWLRLHPGARHAPFAEVPTIILLRHGHLLMEHA